MFKYFKNIFRVNKVWQILLSEKYLKPLEGKIGNTVIKIAENPESGNSLIVQTDNTNVKSILKKNQEQILKDVNDQLGIFLTGITII